ncbi:MAG TPA: ABC transporter permease subunit [Candidatus Acidoferrales bacterium]|nr:ABC transporter permease subunit [Candidatus Acidoferrales bacterium]
MSPRRANLIRLTSVVVVVALWAFFARIIGEDFLPGPLLTLHVIAQGFSEGWLWRATLTTLSEVVPAFAIAAIVGLFFGAVLGLSRVWGEVFEPLIVGVYAVPKVTLYPIFLLVFKVGAASKIAFGMFHGVFPVQIIAQAAIAHMRPVYLKVARSLNLSPAQTLIHVVIPALIPALVVGLRLGFSLTFIGVVLGEIFASRGGLGFLLSAADQTFDVKRVNAVIVILAVLGVGVNVFFNMLERRVAPVSGSERQATLAG